MIQKWSKVSYLWLDMTHISHVLKFGKSQLAKSCQTHACMLNTGGVMLDCLRALQMPPSPFKPATLTHVVRIFGVNLSDKFKKNNNTSTHLNSTWIQLMNRDKHRGVQWPTHQQRAGCWEPHLTYPKMSPHPSLIHSASTTFSKLMRV